MMNVAQLLNDKIKRSNITINTTVPLSKPAKGNYKICGTQEPRGKVPINTPWAGDSTAPPTASAEDLEAAELLSLS